MTEITVYVVCLAHQRYAQEIRADTIKTARHAAHAKWFDSPEEAREALDGADVHKLVITEEIVL